LVLTAQEWDKLDAESQKSHTALAQLPEKFVLILRDKAMQARIRAHHAKINRFHLVPACRNDRLSCTYVALIIVGKERLGGEVE